MTSPVYRFPTGESVDERTQAIIKPMWDDYQKVKYYNMADYVYGSYVKWPEYLKERLKYIEEHVVLDHFVDMSIEKVLQLLREYLVMYKLTCEEP